MADRTRKDGIFTLAGVALGAAIGGAVGLVYTPASGEENRRRLREWVNARIEEARGKAETQAGQIRSRVESQAVAVRSRVETKAEEIREVAQARVEEVRDKAQSALPSNQPPNETQEELTSEDAIVHFVPEGRQAKQSGEEEC